MELSLEGVCRLVEEFPVVGGGDALSAFGDSRAVGGFGVMVRRYGCGDCEGLLFL